MADGKDLDLKVYLEPHIANEKALRDELQGVVSQLGDKVLQDRLDGLNSSFAAMTSMLQKLDSASALDNLKTEAVKVANEINSIAQAVGKVDQASIETANKLDQKLSLISDKIAAITEKISGYKALGSMKDGKFQYTKTHLNQETVSADIKRVAGTGGQTGAQIKTFQTLESYRQTLLSLKDRTVEQEKSLNDVNNLFIRLSSETQQITKDWAIQGSLLKKQIELKKTTSDEIHNLATQTESNGTTVDAGTVKTDELVVDKCRIEQISAAAIEGKSDIKTATSNAKQALKISNMPKDTEGGATIDVPSVDVGEAPTATKDNTGTVGKAIKSFTSYTLVLGTMKRAIRTAVDTIQVLDKALTEQAMVSGKTREETYSLLKSYQDIAAAAGSTTKEVASVATQYFRQGKSAQEALTLTEAAVKAAKVASISTSDSVDYLTTAINGFKLEAEDAMAVSDRFAALAASSATSYEELATALSKVASQANLAGMSMDYTLGLLAKGVETTREAPETIGTALKTVIARMREIGDYGETLEGDIDINKVEQQLSYVDIALRNQNGELRSTEDVLDELGRKWDKLNANQQASIAKALAGTRQQSRLISMMQNYDRTLELVDISENSLGATAAQAATYMEGMEAATNKVAVAWEKVITGFTNSDLLINAVNAFAGILDKVAELTESIGGQVAIYGLLAAAIITVTTAKIKEKVITAYQNKAILENNVLIAKNNKEEADATVVKLERAAATARAAKADALAANDMVKYEKASAELAETEAQLSIAKKQSVVYELEYSSAQSAALTGAAKLSSILTGLIPLYGIINIVKTVHNKLKEKSIVLDKAQTLSTFSQVVADNLLLVKTKELTIAQALYNIVAAVNPLVWVVAAAIALAGIVTILYKMINKTEEASKRMEDLALSITSLSKTNSSLEQLVSTIEDLDNKLIKTNEDSEELVKTLESAKDLLSEAQQNEFNTLGTQGQIEYLKSIIELNNQAIKAKQASQIAIIASNPNIFDESNKNTSLYKTGQAAVIDQVNADIKDRINQNNQLTDEEKKSIENLSKRITENANPADLYQSAIDNSGAIDTTTWKRANWNNFAKQQGVKLTKEQKKALMGGKQDEILASFENDEEDYTKIMTALGNKIAVNEEYASERVSVLSTTFIKIGEDNVLAANVLQDTSQSFNDQIAAYHEIANQLTGADKEAFEADNKELISLYETFSGGALTKISQLGLGANDLNDANAVLKKMGNGKSITDLMEAIAGGKDREQIIEDWNLSGDALKYFESAYTSLMTKSSGGFSTLSQNMTKFDNDIQTIYKTQSEWMTKSAQEKASFIGDYQDLANMDGFMDALESGGNLSTYITEHFEKQRLKIIQDIENQIAATTNAAEKKRLEERLAYYQNTDYLYAQSLEIQLEYQKNYIDQYKSYLEEQKDAEVKSLEERRDAYQKYFDAINQQYDTESYEEERDLIISNILKLSAGTDAASIKQVADLNADLTAKEEERIKTLRENAQEKVLDNIDSEIEIISNKFDDLINNNQAMLQALLTDGNGNIGEKGSSILASMMNGILQSTTATEIEKANSITTLMNNMAPLINGLKSKISAEEIQTSSGNNVTIKIGDQTVDLTGTDKGSYLYNALMQLLQNANVAIGSK